ncbi:MAG: hypothetical protein NT157_06330 [Candidatus Micrarchaeota archaeon]|nr:hypothetical protein [Candidatus Micrarchaeota archaeon]
MKQTLSRLQAPVRGQAGFAQIENTMAYLSEACGGDDNAERMLNELASLARRVGEKFQNAVLPGERDRVMHDYNLEVEQIIGKYVRGGSMKQRLMIVGGITATASMLGALLPIGAIFGAMLGGIAGSLGGTLLAHGAEFQGHGGRVRRMLKAGHLDHLLVSRVKDK